MRVIHFRRKPIDTHKYLIERALNAYIPVVLAFYLGYSGKWWLIPIILSMIVFEVTFTSQGVQARY